MRDLDYFAVLIALGAIMAAGRQQRRPYHGDRGDESCPPFRLPGPEPEWAPPEPDEDTRTFSVEEIRRFQFLKWLQETGKVPS